MPDLVVWHDVPVVDLDRAINFYSKVLNIVIDKCEGKPGDFIGIFPHDDHTIGGCLYVSEEVKPSDHGVMIYYNVGERMIEAENLVAENGGEVLQSRHSIGPHGFRVVVRDSEGNRIALHSDK